MRKLWAVLALVGALAMVPVLQVEAGGKKTNAKLYVAEYVANQTPSQIVDPPVKVGNVQFEADIDAEPPVLKVRVSLQKGKPSTTYVVFIPPSDGFGSTVDQGYELMTDGKGKGSLSFSRSPAPSEEEAPLPTEVAIVMRNGSRPVFDSETGDVITPGADSIFRTPDTTITWK